MSNQVNNLAASFVAMAQAFEQLPQVQSELNRTNGELNQARDIITSREETILKLKQEIEAQREATRKAEVERDHAEQMFLEADDKLAGFKRFLSSAIGDASTLLAALEPPKPEPTPEPVTVDHTTTTIDHGGYVGESAPLPSSDASTAGSSPSASQSEPVGESAAGEPATTVGSTTGEQASQPVSDVVSQHSEGVSVQPDPTPVTETSSENVLPVSPQHEGERVADPTAASVAGDGPSPVSASPTLSADAQADANTGSESAVDPTSATTASSSTETGSASKAPDTSASSVESTSTDDVGYHNEPKIDHNKQGPDAWTEWDKWCAQMNTRYGNQWPPRSQAAQ